MNIAYGNVYKKLLDKFFEKNNNQKVDIILYTTITMFNAYIYILYGQVDFSFDLCQFMS